MISKQQAADTIREAKAGLGLTWAQIAEAVGAPVAWTVSALLGEQPMTRQQAAAAATKLNLDREVQAALRAQPVRGTPDARIPADPAIYRFYEVLQAYGTTIRELIHEEFGDGIMSATNFRLEVTRVPDPAGDRVVVTMGGTFLPYQW